MSKYNQQGLDTLNNFFSDNFNTSPFRVYETGTHVGQVYISRKHLTQAQAQRVNEFCHQMWGTAFKVVQIQFNKYLRRGAVMAEGFEPPVPPVPPVEEVDEKKPVELTPEVVSSILRLADFLNSSKMTPKELRQIISQVYD